ncbi:hypothetical protein BIW11_05425, partial [Tropilaelaps mercedesae]
RGDVVSRAVEKDVKVLDSRRVSNCELLDGRRRRRRKKTKRTPVFLVVQLVPANVNIQRRCGTENPTVIAAASWRWQERLLCLAASRVRRRNVASPRPKRSSRAAWQRCRQAARRLWN